MHLDQGIEYFCLVLPLGGHILGKCPLDIVRGQHKSGELLQRTAPGIAPGKPAQYAVKKKPMVFPRYNSLKIIQAFE